MRFIKALQCSSSASLSRINVDYTFMGIQVISISTGFLVSSWCVCVVLSSLSRNSAYNISLFVSKVGGSMFVVCLLSVYSFLSSSLLSLFSVVHLYFPFPADFCSPLTRSFLCLCWCLTHRKPSHANNDIQTPLLAAGVFERPHTVAIHIPVSTGSRVHTALADFAGAAGSGFVDDTLLDDGAVYGEAVRWCCGSGCCG